jgi:tetratricopeptide (TPR) repeat protein
MHVESVVWVTERKDVLYGIFYMLALVDYQNYLRDRKFFAYGRVLLWGLLSVLAKPMGVTLPFVLFLCDWFYGRRDFKKMVLEKVPFLFIVTPITCVTYALNVSDVTPNADLVKVILVFVRTLTFYVEKFFYPWLLVPNYTVPEPVSLAGSEYILSMAIFILLSWCAIRHRKDRWVVFAAGFYLLAIFLILRVSDNIVKGAMADRYMYIASVGFCILAGVVWERLCKSFSERSVIFRRASYFCLTVLMAALCFKTYTQSMVWKDSLTLWNYVIAHAPERSFFYNNRGTAYLNRHEYALALADFNRVLSMDPDSDDALYNRGQIYKWMGRYDLAMADFNKAVTLSPNFADAYNNLGSVCELNGRNDLALDYYNKAVAIDPHLEKGYNNRGVIYLIKKQNDLALADFNKALAINPNMTDALNNRGSLYRTEKKYDLALEDFNKALSVSPTENAYINRGITYGFKGRNDLALDDLDRALALNPNNVMAYTYELQKYEESVASLTKAVELEPDNYLAYRYRSFAYGHLKKDDLALGDLNQMIRLNPKSGRNYFNRSVCYRNLGQYKSAYADLVKAASLGYHPNPAYTNTLRKLLEE